MAMLQKTGVSRQAITGKSLPEAFGFYKDLYDGGEAQSTIIGSLKRVIMTGEAHEMPVVAVAINRGGMPSNVFWKISHVPVRFGQSSCCVFCTGWRM